MKKKGILFFILLCLLTACNSKNSTSKPTFSSLNSSSNEPITYTDWPQHILDEIKQSCNGFSIPFFEAGYYESEISVTESGTFTIIHCYDFLELGAVERYTQTLINEDYEIEDYTEDYGCFLAQKHISTSSTSIIQYNTQTRYGITYFMIATCVSGTTQAGNQTNQWPSEVAMNLLQTDIPHFEASLYIYSSYLMGDGSLGLLISCYDDNLNENCVSIYEETLISNQFSVSNGYGVKGSLNLIFYYSAYEGEPACFVILAYLKEVKRTTWPQEEILKNTGLTLPAYQQENIYFEFNFVTDQTETFYCIWIWGANDQSLSTYHALLIKEGWIIDTTIDWEDGYVFHDIDNTHTIKCVYYPKELTNEVEDCLFIMIQ